MTSRYASSASANVAGWSLLIRATTVGSSAFGSISRAAADACLLVLRRAAASRPRGCRRRRARRRRAGRRAGRSARARAPSRRRPAPGAARSQSAYSLDGGLRVGRCPLEAALVRVRLDADPGRDDLVEQARQVLGRLELEALPQADLRSGRPRPALGEEGRHALEAAGDRREALGERREVAGEEQEQRIADRVHRRRAALPGSDDLGVEQRPAQVVRFELALEGRLGRQAGRVERLDRREVGALVGELLERRSREPSPSRASSVWMPSKSPRSGCRGGPAGTAPRPGRRSGSSSGPGVGGRRGAGQGDRRAGLTRSIGFLLGARWRTARAAVRAGSEPTGRDRGGRRRGSRSVRARRGVAVRVRLSRRGRPGSRRSSSRCRRRVTP